jgi:hypothetical protein
MKAKKVYEIEEFDFIQVDLDNGERTYRAEYKLTAAWLPRTLALVMTWAVNPRELGEGGLPVRVRDTNSEEELRIYVAVVDKTPELREGLHAAFAHDFNDAVEQAVDFGKQHVDKFMARMQQLRDDPSLIPKDAVSAQLQAKKAAKG